MTTAIISGACAVVAAIITGLLTYTGTLRSKRVDLLANSEERKAEHLERGYNTMLAAADFGWHYRCHNRLRYYGNVEPPFDWDEEFSNIGAQLEALFSRATDLLKANSLHFDTVSPALLVLFDVVWTGQTVSKMEAMPEDYEKYRQLVIEMSRVDGRLSKPPKRNFWRDYFRSRKPVGLNELSAEDQFRRANAILTNSQADAVYIQNEDALVAFIESFQKNPPILADSLRKTASRIRHWKDEEIIKTETPCDNLTNACYEEPQKIWLSGREKDDQGTI